MDRHVIPGAIYRRMNNDSIKAEISFESAFFRVQITGEYPMISPLDGTLRLGRCERLTFSGAELNVS
jgi:hypothetical protein